MLRLSLVIDRIGSPAELIAVLVKTEAVKKALTSDYRHVPKARDSAHVLLDGHGANKAIQQCQRLGILL